jgi:hypothetical protein
LPTSCEGPLQSSVEAVSWGEAAVGDPLRMFAPSKELESLEGCGELPFGASISVTPDVPSTSTTTALNVALHVRQDASLNSIGLAHAAVKDIALTLPAGVTINPAAADGLETCSESQIGFQPGENALLGETAFPGRLYFTPTLPELLSPGLGLGAEGFCPGAAKVGTAEISTPLLPPAQRLKGVVYLAAQNANPFGSLLAMYLVAEDPVSRTLVKLPGQIALNQQTGQITATFASTPQLPLEDIELQFFGGERALLATPVHCGSYTTEASFTPWSGEEPVSASSNFEITTGPGGGVCPIPLSFAPSLNAGTTSNEAGHFSPLTLTVGREDGQQDLQSFQLRLPPGVEGILSNVSLCSEAQANADSCAPASQIGETTVSAGLGSDPYTVVGGKVYLRGPYSGTGSCTPGEPGCAPFGLSIVTPVRAGPLDLEDAPENHPPCDCLVIRAKVEVDPQTAQLTIATGAIPHIIDGIPLEIKHLNITINRPGFIFNSTSCTQMQAHATISSDEGATSTVSVPYQADHCANLKFNPEFSAATEGHAEALKGGSGASLNVKIASRSGPGRSGEEANIKRVDLTLPKLLPARLQPTLQNACTGAQFAKDPADCPPDSFVGTATAVTPVLGVPLRGPAIFVSRGGAALPDLDLVLQGEGVEILLTGHTDVKGEVTYSRFETFPDTPISSFALSLPEGPHSALASGLPTNENSLCGQSLEMPATIEGQNGVVVKQDTRVRIEGCKPALYIRSTRVSGTSVTVTVTVPSAGKIVAAGEGLSRQTKHPGGEKLVTLKLTLSRAQEAKLAKAHRLKARVELAFTPKRGRRLTKSVAVGFVL